MGPFPRSLHAIFFLCHLDLARHPFVFDHELKAFVFLGEGFDFFVELLAGRLDDLIGVVVDVLDLSFKVFVHGFEHSDLGFDFFVSLFDSGVGGRELEGDFLTWDHMFVNIKHYNNKKR